MLLPVHWYNVLSLVILTWAWRKYVDRRRRNPKGLPHPPGPKGYPVIGCLFENSAPYPWIQYAQWAKEYGDMFYFEVLGQPFMILNSLKRTGDLLEKRSKKYSDRLWTAMILDLMNWDYNIGLLPYGTGWRRRRRLFHNFFNINSSNQYVPIQTQEVRKLLKDLLADNAPASLARLVRRTFAGTIMRITYGIPVDSKDNEYVVRAEEAITGFGDAAVFGTYWVDYFPLLKHIPPWFPGASFRRKAAYYSEVNHQVRTKPFDLVKGQVATNTAPPSVAAKIIQKLPREDNPSYAAEKLIGQDVTAIAFAAGADTTLSSIHAFFLAMAMYPDTMRQAQNDIDRVVGTERLPTVEDKPSLPFVEAICKELLRWHNVLPTAVPHMTSEDDEYDGYFIPKGTLVIGNAWAILHDETVFEKPSEFMPNRYIKDGEINQEVMDAYEGGTFGYGRRICPGRYLAANSLFLIVSNMLAVFDILAPLEPDGQLKKLSYKTSSGLLIYPDPVDYRILPRSPQAENLIRTS